MFQVLKLKPILVFALIIGMCFGLSYFIVRAAASANTTTRLNYTIVLDAGHGGRDAGVVGIDSGVKESDINLSIVRLLQGYLRSFGFNVVLTRSDANGLYRVFGRDYKLEDMNARHEIIRQNNAHMVISIHLNSFSDRSVRGAQVFYNEGSQSSRMLAETIRDELVNNLPYAKTNLKYGDYYILKATSAPSVMVEGGFLTNPDEERLLQTPEYQQKLAYFIFCGIVRFFTLS